MQAGNHQEVGESCPAKCLLDVRRQGAALAQDDGGHDGVRRRRQMGLDALQHALAPRRKQAIQAPLRGALQELHAFHARDAADGVNALALHVGAKIEMPWILKIAYGIQAQLVDAQAVARQEIDAGGVQFEARAAHDRLPAVRTAQALQAHDRIGAVVARV